MTSPSFSIIMPSFNSEVYIEEAIHSAVSQMEWNDELVIQDGDSSDGTLEIIRRLGSSDGRIKIESSRDNGQSDALNKALKRANAQYVVWLNSDDILNPGALGALRREIQRAPSAPSLVFGGHSIVRADGSVIAEYHPKTLDRRQLILKGCYVFSGSVAVDRHKLTAAGGFSSSYDYCMDLDLFFRLLNFSEGEIRRVSNIVGTLRWHDASKSGSSGWKFVADGRKVRQEHAKDFTEHCLSLIAAVRQSVAIAATPVRHSLLYSRVRGTVRA